MEGKVKQRRPEEKISKGRLLTHPKKIQTLLCEIIKKMTKSPNPLEYRESSQKKYLEVHKS